MDSTEYKVSGDSSSHSDLSSLTVTDLTDEDDIRVLTQDGSEAARECHSGLSVNLDLVQSGDPDFYRVLNCNDINFISIFL